MEMITVGMDESPCAAEALRWAVAEGEGRGWPVRAVLAWSFVRQHHIDRAQSTDPEYSEEDAVLALQRYVAEAVGSAVARGIELDVVSERPAVGLIEAASGSPLLVVGSHGHGGISGFVLGSVSQECLHHSTVPVAIVRPVEGVADSESAEVMAGKIVVGIDGSDTSRRALTWALDEARARGGWVEVVHSWLLPAAYGYLTLPVPDSAAYEEDAEALVSRFIEKANTSGLSRPISRIIVGGTSTAGLLADRAANAELIVVGSRGIGGFRGMLIGSVAQHLARHAPCPLIVIPATHAAG